VSVFSVAATPDRLAIRLWISANRCDFATRLDACPVSAAGFTDARFVAVRTASRPRRSSRIRSILDRFASAVFSALASEGRDNESAAGLPGFFGADGAVGRFTGLTPATANPFRITPPTAARMER